MMNCTPVSYGTPVSPCAIIPVVGATDIRTRSQSSDMRSCTYPPAIDINASSDNASKIEACINAGEDHASAGAVIESVRVAGDTAGKHNGKGYSKKRYTYNPVHFISFSTIEIELVIYDAPQ